MNYNLMTYRKMLKLTQEEIGSQLGMSKASYSKRETGIRDFKQTEMLKIMELINKEYPTIEMSYIFLKIK